MADTVFKKKILEKRTHKVANQPSTFVEDTPPAKALIQPAHENGIFTQGIAVESVDMMRLAQYCDTAVLVSEDGDFVYVVNTIAEQGVRVEIVGLKLLG